MTRLPFNALVAALLLLTACSGGTWLSPIDAPAFSINGTAIINASRDLLGINKLVTTPSSPQTLAAGTAISANAAAVRITTDT